jgi:hypothetical protein
LKRICSIIDELPAELDFEVPQLLQPQPSEESGLSQGLESHHLSDHSSQDAASLLEEADSQSSRQHPLQKARGRALAGTVKPNFCEAWSGFHNKFANDSFGRGKFGSHCRIVS